VCMSKSFTASLAAAVVRVTEHVWAPALGRRMAVDSDVTIELVRVHDRYACRTALVYVHPCAYARLVSSVLVSAQ
jgi:hypothetical protein